MLERAWKYTCSKRNIENVYIIITNNKKKLERMSFGLVDIFILSNKGEMSHIVTGSNTVMECERAEPEKEIWHTDGQMHDYSDIDFHYTFKHAHKQPFHR